MAQWWTMGLNDFVLVTFSDYVLEESNIYRGTPFSSYLRVHFTEITLWYIFNTNGAGKRIALSACYQDVSVALDV